MIYTSYFAQLLIPDYIKSKMDVPVWINKDWHIALICYERPTDFCHRHLVSKMQRIYKKYLELNQENY